MAAGHLDLAGHMALSCPVNPVAVGGQILKAAMALREAAQAAAVCEETCTDVMHTAVAHVPIVCKLLRLGQLFPDDGDAADLEAAMRQCCGLALDALDDAVMAIYQYLQGSTLSRMWQPANVAEIVEKKGKLMRHRLKDVDAYVKLSTMLSKRQSTQQAQHTAHVVQEVQQRLRQMADVRTADKARVQSLVGGAGAADAPRPEDCVAEGTDDGDG